MKLKLEKDKLNTQTTWITASWGYIQHDWQSNRVRFCAEVIAWACSVISAVMFAATVPNIPVVPLYSIFITGCVCSAYACYNRRSFGLLANSVFLIIIDGIGLIRYFIVT